MAENNLFTLKIITPDRIFYEGQVSMVEFNTTEGEIGVYKRHVPTTVIISPGIVTITEAEGVKEAALHAGFAEILQDEVVIMGAAGLLPGGGRGGGGQGACRRTAKLQDAGNGSFACGDGAAEGACPYSCNS